MAIYYNNQFRNYYLGTTGSLGKMYYGGVEVNPGSGTAPALWTPEDLSNLYCWWRADTGITTSGTNVTSWASKAGAVSRTLVQAGGSTNSVYNSADSSFNNQATIEFPSNRNGCLTIGDVSSSLSQISAVCFIFSPLGLPRAGYDLMGGFTSTGGASGEIAIGPSTNAFNNEYSAYTFTGGQKTSGVASTNGGKQFMIGDFSGTAGNIIFYPNSTTGVSTDTTVSSLNPNVRYSAGGYGEPGNTFAGTIGFYGKIMEMIITTGTRWTAQDVSDLSNYVSTYY
jgi:hypothetical protein